MADLMFPYSASSTLYFLLIASATAAHSTAGSGSLLGTNIRISKDGAAFATSTNTGTVVGNGFYSLVLTDTETSAKQILVDIAGSGGSLGTLVEAQAFLIRTYGSASAFFPFMGAGSAGTPLVNLVANQSTATIGTVAFVATGTITQVGTVTFLSSGTITTALNTLLVNVSQVSGTNVVATAGRMNVGSVDFVATGTITQVGTVTTVLGGTIGTVTGTVVANVTQINASGSAAQNLGYWGNSIVSSSATGTINSTGLQVGLTETTDNYYRGRNLTFISGTGIRQSVMILSSTGSISAGVVPQRFIVSTLAVTPAAGDNVLIGGAPSDVNVTYWVGTITTGAAGTPLVNLVANQSTATVGTVLFVATGTITQVGTVTTVLGGTIGTVTGVVSADVIRILATAVVGTSGTLTNVGTVGLLLTGTVTTVINTVLANVTQVSGTNVTATGGREEVNVSHWLGTAGAGSAGTPLVNLVANQSTATIGTAVFLASGTITTALNTLIANVVQVAGNATAANNLRQGGLVIATGTALSGTLNTTSFSNDLTDTSGSHYNGRVVIWVTGGLAKQAAGSIDYTGSSVGTLAKITVTTMTTAPASGDTFIII